MISLFISKLIIYLNFRSEEIKQLVIQVDTAMRWPGYLLDSIEWIIND